MTLKLWLRDEVKANERRTPLVPSDAKKLISEGVELVVEESEDRIIPTKDYSDIGATIMPSHSWKKEASNDFTIIGLKEITDTDISFHHRHIYFAHLYKGQSGSEGILERYKKDGGTLFDLEYLTDKSGKRVSAFGHWAGFAGAAIALDQFFRKQSQGDSYPSLNSFDDIETLKTQISTNQRQAKIKEPRCIIIGAKGRCGQGAEEILKEFTTHLTLWDYEETKKGGPFPSILENHIFINAALITKKIPPFLIKETLESEVNHLQVLADVSCDPTSEINPIPIYHETTSWARPFLKTSLRNNLEILSVDNLPSLLPKESSYDFSSQLLPQLLDLNREIELPTAFKNSQAEFLQQLESID